MVTYENEHRTAKFDGYKFRKDLKTGYYLSSKPTHEGKRERLHVYVWRYYNGDIPKGYHVHHIDENKDHNDIENLELLPQHEHMSLHSNEYINTHHEEIKAHTDKIRPLAAEWHKSEDGREWHRQNMAQIRANNGGTVFKPEVRKCLTCGKEYVANAPQSKFCCNACKTRNRKQSGIDNEERKCIVCGKPFVCDKYAYKRTCSANCTRKLHRNQADPQSRS